MGSYSWKTIKESPFGTTSSQLVDGVYVESQINSNITRAGVAFTSGSVIETYLTTLSAGTVIRAQFYSVLGTYNTSSVTVGTNKRSEKSVPNVGDGGSAAYIRLQEQKYISTPPSTPSSISVTPSAVQEGSTISISWGTSTNSPSSYRLERSINGGSYSQIYSGSTRSYSDTALASWNTVQYRVRAYNSDGYSGYRTSTTTVTVTHNTAPTTPSSITVPELKGGKTATISWGSSTDSDGDSLTYYLERSIDGGTYGVIKNGTSTTSYTDTIGDAWVTATYRVRAYDGEAYSDYKTSSAITVKHFPEFNMKVGGALTTSQDGWVKVGGALKKIEDISIKVNGALKEI